MRFAYRTSNAQSDQDIINSLSTTERISVRVNSIDTPFFEDDISAVVSTVLFTLFNVPSEISFKLTIPLVRTLVLPKIHTTADLDKVSKAISQRWRTRSTTDPIKVVASIESARALWEVGEIAGWKSRDGVISISALLVGVIMRFWI